MTKVKRSNDDRKRIIDLAEAGRLRDIRRRFGHNWTLTERLRISAKIKKLESRWAVHKKKDTHLRDDLLAKAKAGDAKATDKLLKKYKIKVILPKN